jgi:hypothetical protein
VSASGFSTIVVASSMSLYGERLYRSCGGTIVIPVLSASAAFSFAELFGCGPDSISDSTGPCGRRPRNVGRGSDVAFLKCEFGRLVRRLQYGTKWAACRGAGRLPPY